MKNLYIIFLLLFFQFVFGQKENNHWFLWNYHIDFNESPAAIHPNSYDYAIGSSISTPDGQLMFYTNGNTVFDKFGNQMTNGHGLLDHGLPRYTVIVPVPGSCTKYYVISSGMNCANYPTEYTRPCVTNDVHHPDYGKDEGVKYSIVNMDDNGNDVYDVQTDIGFVESMNKKIEIPEPTGNASLTVLRHANGQDYWLIAGDGGTNKFHVYEIKSNGIFPAEYPYYEQNIPGGIRLNIEDGLKANSQGNKLVGTSYPLSYSGENYIQVPFLLDFNTASGRISNLVFIENNPMNCPPPCYFLQIAGYEFSPDGTQLYFTDSYGLYQMQVLPTISNPVYVLDNNLIPGEHTTFHEIALSPENPSKIIFSHWTENPPIIFPAAVLHNPNQGGAANVELNYYPNLIVTGSFPRFVEGGGVWPKDPSCFYVEPPCPEPDFQPFKPAVPDLFSEDIEVELSDNYIHSIDKEFGDIDGDGDVDILFVKQDKLNVLFNNSGLGNPPSFAMTGIEISLNFPSIPDHPNFPGMIIDPISYKLFDWDSDGDLDLILLAGKAAETNRVLGGVFLFLNDGTGNFPNVGTILLDAMSFGDENGHDPQNDFPAEYFQLIEIGDLNNDGKPDILVSGRNRLWGTAYFENTGTIENPSFILAAPQQIVSSSNWTNWIQNIAFPIQLNWSFFPLHVPELYSIECSEKLDLFISESLWEDGAGRVFYHENNGGTTTGTLPDLNLVGINNQFGLNDDPHSNYPNADFPNFNESPLNCFASVVRFVDFLGNACPIAIVYNYCSKKFYYYDQDCDGMSVSDADSFAESLILLYPNPATNEVSILVKQELKIYGIQIFDLNGKLIRQPKVSNQKIDTSELGVGVYYVNFKTDKGLIAEKLIIK